MKGKFGKSLLASLFLVPLLIMPLLVAAPVMAGSVTYDYTGAEYNLKSLHPVPGPDPALGVSLTASFTFDDTVVTDNYTGSAYSYVYSSSNHEVMSGSATSGLVSFSISTYNDPLLRSSYFDFVNGNIVAWYYTIGDYDSGSIGHKLESYFASPYSTLSYYGYDRAANWYVGQTYVSSVGKEYYPAEADPANNGLGAGHGTWTKQGSSNQVAEPATMLLLGLGLMGFAGVRRKFKK